MGTTPDDQHIFVPAQGGVSVADRGVDNRGLDHLGKRGRKKGVGGLEKKVVKRFMPTLILLRVSQYQLLKGLQSLQLTSLPCFCPALESGRQPGRQKR